MNGAPRCIRHWTGVFVSVGLLVFAASAHATLEQAVPPRGSVAPAFALESLHSERVTLEQFAEKPVVLIFGDLRHEGAKKASSEVLRVLKDPRLVKQGIVPIFVTAESTPLEEMQELVEGGNFPVLVLHDPHRDAFGAYKILVVPSVVVVDGNGIVVYAMPGFLPRFVDLLTQSLLVSTGQMTDEVFEASIDAKNGAPVADPNALRAERLVHLGEQLLKHGLDEMAEARFREAVQLMPGYEPARLALGEQYRTGGKIDDAEAQFRAILDENPDSVAGALALARVQIDRGGDSLNQAEATIRAVLARLPETPRAHYQLGLIYESRGYLFAAAASYRKAAELLLAG